MSSDYDATEFIDGDFEGRKSSTSSYAPAVSPAAARAPSREEVDSRVTETQQRLVELKRAQENLERERSALEETRRRQLEFQTGRQEMVQNLTRGLGLLEEAEFALRRESEQMAKAMVDLRTALSKVQAVKDEGWTTENFHVELTRALTTIENARMEWNTARLKLPVLSETGAQAGPHAGEADAGARTVLGARSFSELCRLGLALTWPIAASLIIITGLLLLIYLRR